MLLATDLGPDGMHKQCQTQSPCTVSEAQLATTPQNAMSKYSDACRAAQTMSHNGAGSQTIASAQPIAGRIIDRNKQEK